MHEIFLFTIVTFKLLFLLDIIMFFFVSNTNSVHCTSLSVQCTLYTVQCTVYIQYVKCIFICTSNTQLYKDRPCNIYILKIIAVIMHYYIIYHNLFNN